jgi:hypothetical protein
MSKADAHQFFTQLEAHLNSKIPAPEITRAKIKAAVDRATTSGRERQNAFAEGAFLNQYVIGHLHSFLSSEFRFSSAHAKRAILSESYRSHPDLVSGSPVRPGPHPFRKVIGASPRQINGNLAREDEREAAGSEQLPRFGSADAVSISSRVRGEIPQQPWRNQRGSRVGQKHVSGLLLPWPAASP